MNIIKTDIPDVLIFEPRVFGDARGFFFESFSSKVFNEAVGRQVDFVQDNHSQSQKGVLRGLHYQKGEYSQAKLVRVLKGKVLDVAVDLRRSSPTFGKHVSALLSEENKRQFFIPRGHTQLRVDDHVLFISDDQEALVQAYEELGVNNYSLDSNA